MAKVEGSQWRCTHMVPGEFGAAEECSTFVLQQEMEAHLLEAHTLHATHPEAVAKFFVLAKSVDPRGPGRRGKIDDQTDPMFEFEERRNW